MTQTTIDPKNHKDSVFRILFDDPKELLALYNALNGSNYDNVDDIEINTIEDSTYMKVKNDVSFIFNNELNIFEHQSTPCPNMPLRNLFYVAKLLKDLTDEKDLDVYRNTMVKVPAPKFYVFYNGTDPAPDKEIYRLSDQFEKFNGSPDLELIVTALNINEGRNPDLMAACKSLREYSIFVALVRKYIKEAASKDDKTSKEERVKASVEKAIKECIEKGILCEFFQEHREEVVEKVMWDYNEELHYQNVAKENFDEGVEKGKMLNIIEQVCKKIKKGLDAKTIADQVELPIDQAEAIIKVAKKHAPEYDAEKIYNDLSK